MEAIETGMRTERTDTDRAPGPETPSHPAGSERDRFAREMVEWLNLRLVPDGVTVDADTPLFEDGLIDSIRILELIAWTERAIGRIIPDRQIRMDNFRTVRRIADVFVANQTPPSPTLVSGTPVQSVRGTAGR